MLTEADLVALLGILNDDVRDAPPFFSHCAPLLARGHAPRADRGSLPLGTAARCLPWTLAAQPAAPHAAPLPLERQVQVASCSFSAVHVSCLLPPGSLSGDPGQQLWPGVPEDGALSVRAFSCAIHAGHVRGRGGRASDAPIQAMQRTLPPKARAHRH